MRGLVNRFIENLRNAVWITKEAEKVIKDQVKLDQVKNMYTRNLQDRKNKVQIENIPKSFLNITRRSKVSTPGRLTLTYRHTRQQGC